MQAIPFFRGLLWGNPVTLSLPGMQALLPPRAPLGRITPGNPAKIRIFLTLCRESFILVIFLEWGIGECACEYPRIHNYQEDRYGQNYHRFRRGL